MTTKLGWLRRQLPGVIAVVVAVVGYIVVSLPSVSAAEQERMASHFGFTAKSIALPAADKQQQIRPVNAEYEKIQAWISSVGAAIAMNDLDGDGLANDLCLVDTHTDQVVVTPTPGARDDRYAPFALEPGSLPVNDAIAPMGCTPADLNEDGRMDLLVYLWGRTPVIYLAKADTSSTASTLDNNAYTPVELVPDPATRGGEYAGAQWNTNAVAIDDFDGDGHVDVFIANYFPDSPVLDPTVDGGVEMNDSLSHAKNSGKKMIFCFKDADADSVEFTQAPDSVFPDGAQWGWTLAAASNDLDGDLRPELYIANDHGVDHLLYNKSRPGHLEFGGVKAVRTPGVPKSKQLGNDSFKGMGVDFADLNHDGVYDMFVSNITTPWGIQESNLHFLSTVDNAKAVHDKIAAGEAPWYDHSSELGTAWSGWAWDVKLADFDNNGDAEIAQTTGFVQGEVNRWPNLQELATSHDALIEHAVFWPNVEKGDDIAGDQTLHLFARSEDGRYADIAAQLDLAVPVPTRGIATGDADGDGRLDFAVARQFAEPVFYENTSPKAGEYLGLRLTHEGSEGSPAVGAQVKVTTRDGRTFIQRVDGGSGHAGKRSNEVHIGLGDAGGEPVSVTVCWRDRTGEVHEQQLQLSTGWHDLQLGDRAQER
ncbi:MAG: CRTAC1 family protein [Actinophytocola sp.]|uniref:CRTAC1 family protein n=1 Tax=Actinophytocola sp. TaxID=1872138 RepID=UPI003D6C52BC